LNTYSHFLPRAYKLAADVISAAVNEPVKLDAAETRAKLAAETRAKLAAETVTNLDKRLETRRTRRARYLTKALQNRRAQHYTNPTN
jgi:uncharacterized membrane protein